MAACRWEDAFSRALHESDVSLVVWLCHQVLSAAHARVLGLSHAAACRPGWHCTPQAVQHSSNGAPLQAWHPRLGWVVQVDVAGLCAQEPPALSQSVLLSLVSQLGSDLDQVRAPDARLLASLSAASCVPCISQPGSCSVPCPPLPHSMQACPVLQGRLHRIRASQAGHACSPARSHARVSPAMLHWSGAHWLTCGAR